MTPSGRIGANSRSIRRAAGDHARHHGRPIARGDLRPGRGGDLGQRLHADRQPVGAQVDAHDGRRLGVGRRQPGRHGPGEVMLDRPLQGPRPCDGLRPSSARWSRARSSTASRHRLRARPSRVKTSPITCRAIARRSSLPEPAERHDPVEPVEELGPEERFGGAPIDVVAPVVAAEPQARLGLAYAQVRGEHDQRIAEIDRAPERIGQSALPEHLQEDIEDLRVRLLDLVEQHDREGPAAHGAGQEPLGLGERADQPDGRSRRAELVQVEPEQPTRVAEQVPRQRLGALGLAHAGRAQE